MITASREIFYNVLLGEWKGLNIKLVHISSDAKVSAKVFRLENFIFDEVDACETCQAPASQCDDCEGVVEVLALVGTVEINNRRVEDGFVIPLLGDVIFDLREGLISVLTDTDVVVISQGIGGYFSDVEELETGTIREVEPRTEKINLRLYLLTEQRIKRLALKALQDGRLFDDLAGKKAVVAEVTYVQHGKTPLYLRSLQFFHVYFDEDGRVNKELTFPSRHQGETKEQRTKNSKVVRIGHRDKPPQLNSTQKEIVKTRLLKDFGEDVWENTSARVKTILD